MMRYEKYKNSGIAWLGNIPNHWELRRGRDLFIKLNRKVREIDETITCFRSGLVTMRSNVRTDGFTNSIYEYGYQGIRKGDLIIHEMDAFAGAIGISDSDGKGSPILMVLNCRNGIESYYHYLLKSMSEKGYIYALWKGIRIRTVDFRFSTFRDLFFPTFSIKEQISISQYLDAKTHAIDEKINLLTKKADYYKELRKSIINDAVCKGLDKNVNLQGSEFFFPVNAFWKRYRLKDLGFLYSGLSGKTGDDFNQDDNPNNKGFIPFTNIANNTYLKANHVGTVALGENEKQNKVRKGDLFFLMSSEGYEDVGKTAALAEDIKDTYLNSFCKGYRITKKFCEPYFLNYLLLSDNYRKSLITEGKGFTRINLKMEKVTDFFVYLPPTKDEQTAIATYLDEKTQKIDAIVSNIGKQIEILKELRKTLINDVVTGKIKVVE